MGGLDRKERTGRVGKHRERQEREFFESDFPERNIWLVVIYRALEDIKPIGKGKRGSKKKKDKSMWFFISPASRLKWICENVGIDAEAVIKEAYKRYYSLATNSIIKRDTFYDGEQMSSKEMQTL